MELLSAKKRLSIAIETGESHTVEFKSCIVGPPHNKKRREPRDIAKDIAETLVGFCNADGGTLFLGVEDDGQITGFDGSDKTLSYLTTKYVDRIDPSTPLKDPKVIIIDIEEG